MFFFLFLIIIFKLIYNKIIIKFLKLINFYLKKVLKNYLFLKKKINGAAILYKFAGEV